MSNSIAPGSSADVNVRVTALTTNPNVPVTYKTVILKKNLVNGVNTLTQEMMSVTNTKYLIKYDYVLGENITVPENCILEFDGGSVSGSNSLTLQETYITGSPLFDCNIAGSVKNDMFNVLWIKSGDIGYKVNKAASVFKEILIPQGRYTYTTPIAIEGIKKLISNAELYYNGEYINNTGIFKIKRSWSAYIYIYCLKPHDNTQLNYLDTRTVNAVGLEIQTCNNCEIHFMEAEYFNENLRISDINHSGCCYNKFFIGALASANANIRLYQHDSLDGISWTNENTFVGGRLTHWTDNKQWGDYWNIAIGGPQIDKPSYVIPGAVDNEDTCNGLTFIGTSIETNRKSLLLYNVAHSQFIGMREETSTGFAKIIGRFTDNYYIPKFTEISNIYRSDLSEANQISLINYEETYFCKVNISAKNCLSPSGHMIKYNGFLANTDSINSSVRLNYLCQIGLLLPLTGHLCFAVELSKSARCTVKFIDDNGNNVTPDHNDLNIAAQVSYNSSKKGYMFDADKFTGQYHIPPITGVSKVFVGIDPGDVSFTLFSNVNPELPDIKSYGDTASRPKALPAGVPYYDTDLGKVIYTKTTNYNNQDATVWVDATGATV